MADRPKFWLHRTARFWLGLAGLVFLYGAWISTGIVRWQVARWSNTPSDSTEWIAMIGGGGIKVTRIQRDYPITYPGSGSSGWDTAFQTHFQKMRLAAEWTPYSEAFVPLWMFPVLWTILWPLQLHRADKKEAACLTKLGYQDGD
jgi:hypothetical protein